MSPHQLLGARTALIGVAVLCLITGIAVFTAPGKLRSRPGHKVACLLPWILAAMVMINWKLDSAVEVRHPAVVVESSYGRGWDSVTVRSWRPDHKLETLYLHSSRFSRSRPQYFRRGQEVTVGIKPGALGLRWVSSLS